nr:PREDICTED: uncharacterized protein LOC109029685 [Bemisia tabaci]
MSVEATPDSELRDLVAQALENNGLLSKLRAELRASVFLTLEENEKFQSKKFTNEKLKNYANTAEGCLAISLVRDFLDYFGLEFTLSVFDPEVGLGKDYGFENKENIRRKLSLGKNSDESKPLLSQALALLLKPSEDRESALPNNNASAGDTKNEYIEKFQSSPKYNGSEVNVHPSENEGNRMILRNGDIANLNDFKNGSNNDDETFSLGRHLTDYSTVRSNYNSANQSSLPPLENTNSNQNVITQNMKSLTINIDNNFQDEHIGDLLKTNSSLKSESMLNRDKSNDNYLPSLQSHTFSGSEIEEEISSGDQFNDSLSLGDEDILSDAASPGKKVENKFSL